MKLLAAVMVLLVSTVAAQTEQPCFIGEEAEELNVLLFKYDAFSRNLQWDSLATLMDTTELVGFKDILVQGLRKDGAMADLSIVSMVFGDSITSLEQLEKIPVTLFFSKFMAFTTKGAQGIEEMLRSSSYTLVGCLRESDKTGYAVIKLKMQYAGAPIEAVDVIPLRKRSDGRWFVGLKADLKQMVKAMVGN